MANICLLFKKGDRMLACNYRHVSVTSTPCKLLEHTVYSTIMRHLDKYNLSLNRHAFRKLHSCETHAWVRMAGQGPIKNEEMDVFVMDLGKAFDTPHHEQLTPKYYSNGITGFTLRWVRSSLFIGLNMLLSMALSLV